MSLKDWRETVDVWEDKYGVNKQQPDGSFETDLSIAVAKKPCEKCGRTNRRLHRHHKGNDFFWATIHEAEFAPRYIQFVPEDICVLCNRCHKSIHKRYERILWQLFIDWFGRDLIPPIETCRHYQKLCVEECEEWLTRKGRKRRRSRKRTSSGRRKKS